MPTTDLWNQPASTDSRDAVQAYERAVLATLEYRSAANDHVKVALEADPDFALAHCFKGYQYLLLGTEGTVAKARQAADAAKARHDRLTDRERGHLAALACWADGDVAGAAAIWQRIVRAHPHDLLALRLHHLNAFWRGRDDELTEGPAESLHAWTPDLPGYGSVLGMLAFGLEESGERRRAEDYARRAIHHAPDDLWALHALAHVLEMDERFQEGCDLIPLNEPAWDDRNPFKNHVWWHRALYAVELGRDAEVLQLYDDHLAPGARPFYLDVQNAASLLARLQFLGIDPQERWQALVAPVRALADDFNGAFTEPHKVLALAAAGELAEAERLADGTLTRMKRAGRRDPALAQVLDGLCRAIVAFYRGDAADALDLLGPIRGDFWRLGGSRAQRDVFEQLTIEAALQANPQTDGRALLARREVLRPNSRLIKTAAPA
jgi:tetratricopeptide (TPR) repeat protein